jgi:hypothetical protein
LSWYYSCRSFKQEKIAEDPGLKALLFSIIFRGLKAPAPSGISKYNCSTRLILVLPAGVVDGFLLELVEK